MRTEPVGSLQRDCSESFLGAVALLLERQGVDLLQQSAEAISNSARSGGTIYTCGNGGSAANALHFASDLATGGRGGERLRSECLNGNVASLSAIANDIGFEFIFAYQLEPLIEKKDVLIAFSVSGASRNILRAAALAKARSARVIAFTGCEDSELVQLCDVAFLAPHADYGIVECAHMCIAHALSNMLSFPSPREARAVP